MKDYRDVIIRPIITEATMKMMAEDNKVTFEVVKGVSKIEIAKAVEAAFNVEVVTMNCKPKTKRVGRYVGKTSAVHKAIVKIKEGQTIELFGSEE